MGKMEWPAGPDLCNIFVSVIFLFFGSLSRIQNESNILFL